MWIYRISNPAQEAYLFLFRFIKVHFVYLIFRHVGFLIISDCKHWYYCGINKSSGCSKFEQGVGQSEHLINTLKQYFAFYELIVINVGDL